MKNLKKYLLGFALITTLTLTGCSNQADTQSKEETNTESNQQAKATTNVEITIKDTVNDKEILSQEAQIDENGLEDYLEKNHKAVFKDGMMTELEGIKQDEEQNQYWMYYVNDQMPEVGIGDYQVKDADKIEFRFEQM